MRGTSALWVISLFLSGCTIDSPGYVTTGLQPNNCGTPYQFKPCRGGGSHVNAAQPPRAQAVWPSRPLVVIEEVTGPAGEAQAPGPHDLMDYSRFSAPGHAPLAPALGQPAPEPDK